MKKGRVLVCGVACVLAVLFLTVGMVSAQPADEMAAVYDMIGEIAEVDGETVQVIFEWIEENEDDLSERFGEPTGLDDEERMEAAEYIAENAGVDADDVLAVIDAVEALEDDEGMVRDALDGIIADMSGVDIESVQAVLVYFEENADALQEEFGDPTSLEDERISEITEHIGDETGVPADDVMLIFEALQQLDDEMAGE